MKRIVKIIPNSDFPENFIKQLPQKHPSQVEQKGLRGGDRTERRKHHDCERNRPGAQDSL